MLTPKALIPGVDVAASTTIYYTAPANGKAIVRKMTLCNLGGGAVVVSVYLVPAGDTAGAANCLLYKKSVGVDETFDVSAAVNHVLDKLTTIQADSTGGVCLIVSGFEWLA